MVTPVMALVSSVASLGPILEAIWPQAAESAGQARGLGMVFLPREPERAAQARAFCDDEATKLGLRPLGWRVVPTNHEVLGPLARSNAPPD